MNDSSPNTPVCSLPSWRRMLATLSGALLLNGCAGTQLADNHTRPSAQAKQTAPGQPTMPGDDLPNPARDVLTDSALERMQSGTVMSRRM